MKLLSYHIENYGKIHDQDGNFSEGITSYCEQNGFGKSTLVSFLKAMFYGLASYTAVTKGFVDRLHYYPFSGGKFGGNLTFFWEGDVYKIERFFDKKSAKGDECIVYRNGEVYTGFGEEIGKAVFGLDEESFQKTLFITAEDVEVSSTHSINEKLNSSVEGGLEENDFEGAMEALDRARKDLKAARGSGGKINETKTAISDLSIQLKNYEDMERSLTEAYISREGLSREVATLEDAYQEAGARGLVLQKWETFDRMIAKKKEREETLAKWQLRYPNGLPNDEERKELQKNVEEMGKLEERLHSVAFPSGKETERKMLESRFSNGIPSPTLMNTMQEKINRLQTAKGERERLMNQTLTVEETLLKQKFQDKKPTLQDWQEGRNSLEEYKRKQALLSELSSKLLQPKKEEKKFSFKTYALVIGCALLCAGLGLFFVQMILGIALMGSGVVFLVVSLLMKSVNADMPRPNGDFDVVSLQSECKLLEEKLRTFTIPYGYYSEGGVVYDFLQMEEGFKNYQALLEKEEASQAQVKEITEEMETLQREIQLFLHTYGERTENLQSGLQQIYVAIQSYQTLTQDWENSKREQAQLKELYQKAKDEVEKLLQKYNFSADAGTMYGLSALNRDILSIAHTRAEVENLRLELEDYQEKNDLGERPEELSVSAQELYHSLSEARNRLLDCDRKIVDTERYVEKKADTQVELALAEEKLEKQQDTYELLMDTMIALENAEQRLKDQYIAPIKGRFSVYVQALEKVLDEKVSMDKNFRIVFERGGQSRSDRYLSAGEKSVCALCMRLALIDNMYEGEQPFILMDDPFVHLDAIHLERAKKLLHELSERRQILYFCCHESRKV